MCRAEPLRSQRAGQIPGPEQPLCSAGDQGLWTGVFSAESQALGVGHPSVAWTGGAEGRPQGGGPCWHLSPLGHGVGLTCTLGALGPLPRASGPSLGLPLPTDLRVSASHANQRKPGSSMPPQLVGMRPEVPVGGTGEQDGWQAEDLGRVSSVPRRSGWASDRTTAWKPHLPQGTGRASCSERWSPWGAWRP